MNAFLFEHPEGICLYDTGQTARAASLGYLPRWHPFLRLSRFELGPHDEVGARLRELLVPPAGVRWVVLSHLHTDHVGGLAAISSSEVLVSRVEWERARGLAGRFRGYVPQHWPDRVRPRLVELDGPAVGPFPSSHALAPDGTLVIVPLPDHTPGQMGLLAEIEGRLYLAVGDAVHTAAELPHASPAIAAFCEREAVTVLAAHDPAAGDLVGGAH